MMALKGRKTHFSFSSAPIWAREGFAKKLLFFNRAMFCSCRLIQEMGRGALWGQKGKPLQGLITNGHSSTTFVDICREKDATNRTFKAQCAKTHCTDIPKWETGSGCWLLTVDKNWQKKCVKETKQIILVWKTTNSHGTRRWFLKN